MLLYQSLIFSSFSEMLKANEAGGDRVGVKLILERVGKAHIFVFQIHTPTHTMQVA